jgi:hypothetical protein
MADDASYDAFLNKANEPLSAQTQSSNSTSQSHSKYDPTSSTSSVPKPIASLLSSAQPTYTSDTDSPFEPVFFSYSGDTLPSALEFKRCLSKSHSSNREVEQLSVEDFDPREEYKDVIGAVGQAGSEGKADVKVYRVEVSKTRVEYYILAVAEGGRKLVGVVAKAVES